MKDKIKRAVVVSVVAIAKVLFYPFCHTKAVGLENIPKTGGILICPNHISMFDIICLLLTFPRRLYFMAKAELFNHPIKRFFLDIGCAFPVNRGNGGGSAIEKSIDVVGRGEALCIFIEGTRTKNADKSPGKAKSGAVVVATQVNCDVIPVAICYKHGKPRLFSRNYIYYGKPIPANEVNVDLKSKTELRAASEKIMNEIKNLYYKGKEKWQK